MSTAMQRVAAPAPVPAKLTNAVEMRTFLESRAGELVGFAKASGVTPEHMIGELVSVVRRRPDIVECTPDSILTFMYDACKTGLKIGHGIYPVPVKKRGVKQLEGWIGYKGARELVIYGRGARDIYAEIRYEGDPWERALGTDGTIYHREGPNFGDWSKAIGVYAVAVISQSIRRSHYLSKAEVYELRKKNRGDTTASDSPWVTNEKAMWKAKAILRLANDMPSNPRLAAALEVAARHEEPELDPAMEIPAPAAAPALAAGAPAAAQTFEEEGQESPVLILPKWRNHPLSEKNAYDIGLDDLGALYSQLSEAADPRYADLTSQIGAILDERRNAA